MTTSGRHRRARALAATLLAAAAAVPATRAEEPARLGEVVVVADRVPQPASAVPAHVTVLDDDALARTPTLALDDLLRQVPGFQLFRRQSSLVANPTAQGVSLRGLGGSGASRTLVLLDGVPLNDPFGGWVAWSRVPPSALERVEIVRGASATVWGNAAMGGVIDLVTPAPAGRHAGMTAQGGTEATWRTSAVAGDVAGPLAVRLHASHLDFGGVPVVRDDQRGLIDVDASATDTVVDGRARWTVAPAVAADAHVNGFVESRGNGTPYTDNATAAGDADVGVEAVDAAGGRWSLRAFGRVQRFESRFSTQAEDRRSERPALDQLEVPTTAAGGSLLWDRRLTWRALARVAAGVDAMAVEGETREDARFVNGAFRLRRRAGGRETLAGAWAQMGLAPLATLDVTGSLRLDGYWFTDGLREERPLSGGGPVERVRLPGDDALLANPSLGLAWRPVEALTLRAGAYRGFRAPTLNELVRPFRVRNDVTEANPELRPERLWGGEAGVEGRGARWRAQVTGFAQRLDDPILNVTVPPSVCGGVPPGGTCRQRRNAGASRILGVEADVELRPHSEWRLAAGWAFADAEIVSATAARGLVGKRPPQVPRDLASGEIGWQRPRWPAATVRVRWVGSQYEDDRNTIRLGGYALVDAFASWHATERVELLLAVENVLDRTYPVGRSADGLAAVGPPRLVHGGLRVRF